MSFGPRGRIGFDADISGRAATQDRHRRLAEARGQFHNLGAGETGVVEQLFGEGAATRSQNSFAEAGEQPVAGHVLGFAARKGQIARGGVTGGGVAHDALPDGCGEPLDLED